MKTIFDKLSNQQLILEKYSQLTIQIISKKSKKKKKKKNKLQKCLKTVVLDADHLRYLPEILQKVPADSTYKDLQTLKFNIKLPANQNRNWSRVHITLLLKIKSSTNEGNIIVSNVITK